ncbi:MAG: ribosome small subunit-dependent GTPase A [Clostridia bacterium]|nr:ribosome small subunit-dependent GTPase A [Clostridia bacterium]
MSKGIIINNISNMYQVEIDNKIINCNARGKLKKEAMIPVVGDIVEIEVIDEEKLLGIINNIENRKNYIKRPKMANLSQIIFVVSIKMPKTDLLLLDKQIAYAEYNGIKPIICINKIDLDEKELANKIEDTYKSIGYTVIRTVANQGIGVDSLKEILKNNITAFSGNSGVGKSSLINSLFSNNQAKEGLISDKNKRGKNTTTSVKLYKLYNNSYIADTPGFSSFEISEIESKDLYKYFKELKQYDELCEFVGCSHIKEENCGIKRGLENGKITKDRYERYCKIYNELKNKEARKW